VWWLVSPGNPLKPRGPAALARRVAACRAVMRHPRVDVTDIEARLNARFTADTLERLTRRHPDIHFVWLMGADNLATLHRWDRWRSIMAAMPVGVLARPGEQVRAGLSPAARVFRDARLDAGDARLLPSATPPCWTLLTGPMRADSSTAIRGGGAWP
jgi:nicotinate-nucleotide adenylyltransferase